MLAFFGDFFGTLFVVGMLSLYREEALLVEFVSNRLVSFVL